MVLRPLYSSVEVISATCDGMASCSKAATGGVFGSPPAGPGDSLVEVAHHHQPLRRCARENAGKMFQVGFVIFPRSPALTAVSRVGSRVSPRDAQADHGNLPHRSPRDAGREASRRQSIVADVVHMLPGLPGPEQHLPAALLDSVAVAWASADPMPALKQSGVRFRETGDFGRVAIDSVENLVGAPRHGSPLDVPVDELHRASAGVFG